MGGSTHIILFYQSEESDICFSIPSFRLLGYCLLSLTPPYCFLFSRLAVSLLNLLAAYFPSFLAPCTKFIPFLSIYLIPFSNELWERLSFLFFCISGTSMLFVREYQDSLLFLPFLVERHLAVFPCFNLHPVVCLRVCNRYISKYINKFRHESCSLYAFRNRLTPVPHTPHGLLSVVERIRIFGPCWSRRESLSFILVVQLQLISLHHLISADFRKRFKLGHCSKGMWINYSRWVTMPLLTAKEHAGTSLTPNPRLTPPAAHLTHENPTTISPVSEKSPPFQPLVAFSRRKELREH